MERVILLLGGNIGDVKGRLTEANTLINKYIGKVTKRSSMIESQPWGFDNGEQIAPFTNQSVMVETKLTADDLLTAVQEIEAQLGREREAELEEKSKRGVRYLSRKIDIDIIFYGDQIIQSERLTTPHPLMAEREFVLEPIVEIAAEWQHPIIGLNCKELLDNLKE